MKTAKKIEFGDFQTPLPLAQEVCQLLLKERIEADFILEPTCGIGAFLVAASSAFPKAQLMGWDINPDYVTETTLALARAGAAKRTLVDQQDFFSHDWEKELKGIHGRLLVLGNLPWVTSATVSGINGSNLPKKENFHGLRGMEALMGKSNFDISEWMLIRMIQALRGKTASIAMLCKTATARKLLRYAWQNDGRISTSSLYRIDAKYHFNAAVDACLFLVKTGKTGPVEADVFENIAAKKPATTLGLAGHDLVADIHTYRQLKHLEGLCPYQWRSGVKHDCASVMELRGTDETMLQNKLGEEVGIESEYLFPFLKCSDLANGRSTPEKFVIATQKFVGEDTAVIATTAPRTWHYLDTHRKLFEARKSSIYHNRVPFALFGIGDYTFAPWKIAVSALHRTARFMLVGPANGKPVLFDDACYFLPFEDEREARSVIEILNSELCQRFLASLSFKDSKRPITVELLQRLDIQAIADESGLLEEWWTARNRGVYYSDQRSSRQPELIMDTPTSRR